MVRNVQISGAKMTQTDPLRQRLAVYNPDELAAILGVTRKTLAEWRRLRKGPDFVRIEKSILYRQKDVEAWMDLNTVMVQRVA